MTPDLCPCDLYFHTQMEEQWHARGSQDTHREEIPFAYHVLIQTAPDYMEWRGRQTVRQHEALHTDTHTMPLPQCWYPST